MGRRSKMGILSIQMDCIDCRTINFTRSKNYLAIYQRRPQDAKTPSLFPQVFLQHNLPYPLLYIFR